jgi:hypothetical protein
VIESEQTKISVGGFWGVRGFLERKESELIGKSKRQLSCLFWTTTELRAWAEIHPDRNNLLLRALSNDLLIKMTRSSKKQEDTASKR